MFFSTRANSAEENLFNQESMQVEVEKMWYLWLKEHSIRDSDYRYKRIHVWSKALTEEVYNGRNIIMEQVPEEAWDDVHLVIAGIPIHESSLLSDKKSSKGAVGLFQLLSRQARKGKSFKKLKRSPVLNIRLGVQFFLRKLNDCKNFNTIPWRDRQWNYPMSVYMAGNRAIDKKTKRCRIVKNSFVRIKTFKKYRDILRKEFLLGQSMLLSSIEVNKNMNTEELIEAVGYANENDMDWWEVFDSKNIALKAVNAAIKERPEEYNIVMLLDTMELDTDWFAVYMPEQQYKLCLRDLKGELLEAMER